jgi:hypothetical protein
VQVVPKKSLRLQSTNGRLRLNMYMSSSAWHTPGLLSMKAGFLVGKSRWNTDFLSVSCSTEYQNEFDRFEFSTTIWCDDAFRKNVLSI